MLVAACVAQQRSCRIFMSADACAGVCDFILRYDVFHLLRTKVRSRRHRDSSRGSPYKMGHVPPGGQGWGREPSALLLRAESGAGGKTATHVTAREHMSSQVLWGRSAPHGCSVPVRTLCPCPSNRASRLQGCSEPEGCGGRLGTDSLNLRIQRKR